MTNLYRIIYPLSKSRYLIVSCHNNILQNIKLAVGKMPLHCLYNSSTTRNNIIAWLNAYFSGEILPINFSLDMSGISSFQKDVLYCICKIPPGETKSYRWVAKNVGRPRAVRGVGTALHKNPFPVVIPCHRVVHTDGRLGGFSAGTGWKRYLISLEQRIFNRQVNSVRSVAADSPA